MEQNGVDPETYNGNAQEVRRDIQLAQREREKNEGFDFSKLNDDQLSDDYHYCVFPNVTLNTHATNYMMFTQRPHPEDPNKCFYDLQMFTLPNDKNNKRTKDVAKRGGQEQSDDYVRPEHQYVKDGEDHTLGEVLDQDAHNLPFVQKGMNNPAYKGLWCGKQERRIIHFHQVVDRLIMEDGGQVPSYE
jgi:hypothetical protein